MQPANFPLELYRGDSMRLRLTLWQHGGDQPVDLFDAIPKCEIRDRPAGEVIIPVACTVVEPNIIDLYLTPEDSFRLPRQGVWDVQLTFTGGIDREIKTIIGGTVTVFPDVTDSTPSVNPL